MASFSIIITCYNHKAFIGDAVSSALAQTHPAGEVIVVDDASTDGSREVLEGYGDAIRFVAIRDNGGASAARNHGAAVATGDFLAYLDGDDVLQPWALQLFSLLVDARRPKLILGKLSWFTGPVSSLDKSVPPREVCFVEYETFMKKDRNYRASASAMVIERAAFDDVEGFTSGAWPLDDADLMLKLGYSGRTLGIISPSTAGYRQHAENTSRQVQKLIDGVHWLIRNERRNRYPGGSACRFERYSVLGGIVFFWLRKTLRPGLYLQFLKLLAGGWAMVLAAILRRCRVFLRGRRPVEIVPVPAPSA